jgi:hypothetical protein
MNILCEEMVSDASNGLKIYLRRRTAAIKETIPPRVVVSAIKLDLHN